MTSATWLASLLQLEPLGPHSRPTGVKWRLSNTETVFHVIFENAKPQPMATTLQPIETTPQPIATTPQPIATTPQPIATTPQSIATTPQPIATTPQPLVTTPDSGLCVVEAEISSVHLLQHVYSSLVTQLHSLSQWRCEVQSVTSDGGGRERVREEGGREVVSMESLLLPLSCVVLLTVKGETPSSATASPLRFVVIAVVVEHSLSLSLSLTRAHTHTHTQSVPALCRAVTGVSVHSLCCLLPRNISQYHDNRLCLQADWSEWVCVFDRCLQPAWLRGGRSQEKHV